MRQLMIIVILIFLTACNTNNINNDVNNESNDSFTSNNQVEENSDNKEEPKQISDDIKGFKEYAAINDAIQLQDHYIEIVEDNFGKRIMIIKNSDDQEVFKTIFTKKSNRLKIIEFEKGQIFNKIIS